MALVETIISQQISGKVADILVGRLVVLCRGKVTAKKLLALKDEEIRALGISSVKIKYLRSLATRVADQEIDLAGIAQLSDQEIIDNLIKVKGLGPWSAEMFLIFCLEREDVFSIGDGALVRAVSHWYYRDQPVTKKQLLRRSKKWAPYRSYACFYLWESLKRF